MQSIKKLIFLFFLTLTISSCYEFVNPVYNDSDAGDFISAGLYEKSSINMKDGKYELEGQVELSKNDKNIYTLSDPKEPLNNVIFVKLKNRLMAVQWEGKYGHNVYIGRYKDGILEIGAMDDKKGLKILEDKYSLKSKKIKQINGQEISAGSPCCLKMENKEARMFIKEHANLKKFVPLAIFKKI